MPPVYFDGIQLRQRFAKFVLNAMGSLNETCTKCGGSIIEIKSIAIHSSESPITVLTWCATCGIYSRLSQHYPLEWHRRFLAKVGTNLRLPN
ncbi:MAG: hypothetical protein ACLQPD_05085 [Desulfomonilaceae bacterium]